MSAPSAYTIAIRDRSTVEGRHDSNRNADRILAIATPIAAALAPGNVATSASRLSVAHRALDLAEALYLECHERQLDEFFGEDRNTPTSGDNAR